MSVAVAKSGRPLVLGTIMLATFMVAIETTIVATAMPRIVGQLGGFTYYSWVFSAFLLAQSIATPIYGKLSDMFGRKPILVGGILLFLAGSLLCGFAGSMTSLIIFRVLQGLGAGAIYPVSMTVVGDLLLEERSHAQGMLAIVWAVSAVIGPLVGGVIIDSFSWAWIFWINLPFGVLTIAGFLLFLQEKVERRQAQIDYAGALLFSIAIISLLLILTDTDAPATVLAGLAALFVVVGAPVYSSGKARGRTNHLDQPLDAASDRDQQHGNPTCRHGFDRAHDHPADLCAGRARAHADRGRRDLDHAGLRLATCRDAVGPALPDLRHSHHGACRKLHLSARRTLPAVPDLR
jgi:hypothetical protein